MAAQWLALGRLHVSSRVCLGSYSGFLPQCNDMQKVRLIGYSKLSVGVNVSVNGCLSQYVSPVMKRVWVYPATHPLSAGIGSSRPVTLKRIQTMDGWMN